MTTLLQSICWAIIDKLDRQDGIDPSVSVPAINAVSKKKDVVKVTAFYPNGDPVIELHRNGKPRKCKSFERFTSMADGNTALELFEAAGKAVSDPSRKGWWE